MTAPKKDWQRKGKASKLTADNVVALRAAEARGQLNTRQAAQAYGVSVETIRRAVRGDTFGEIGQMRATEDLDAAAAASAARMMALITQERERAALPAKLLDEIKGAPDAGYGED